MLSTSVLKALPGNLDIKRHLPSILYQFANGADPDEIPPYVAFHLGFTVCQSTCLPVPERKGFKSNLKCVCTDM